MILKSVIIIAIAFVLLIPSFLLDTQGVKSPTGTEICGDKICGLEECTAFVSGKDGPECIGYGDFVEINSCKYDETKINYGLEVNAKGARGYDGHFVQGHVIWADFPLVEHKGYGGGTLTSPGPETTYFTEQETTGYVAPAWVENLDDWYSHGKIKNCEFRYALEFLYNMEEEIYNSYQ